MARGPACDVALLGAGSGQPAEVFLDKMPGVGGMMVGELAAGVSDDKVAGVGQGRAGFGVGLGALGELADVMQQRGKRDLLNLALVRRQ